MNKKKLTSIQEYKNYGTKRRTPRDPRVPNDWADLTQLQQCTRHIMFV